MSEYPNKSMRIQAFLRTRMEGLGVKHVIYVEVAPFGLPVLDWGHLWARHYDKLADAQKDYELVESLMLAIFKRENLKMIRPGEEVVRPLESTEREENAE